MNLIKPPGLTTIHRKQRNLVMLPRGHNQPSPEYGELYRTDDLVSSIINGQKKNKIKREAELLEITSIVRGMSTRCNLCVNLFGSWFKQTTWKSHNEPTGGFNHDGIFGDIKELLSAFRCYNSMWSCFRRKRLSLRRWNEMSQGKEWEWGLKMKQDGHTLVIIKAGHGHMGICLTTFFTSVIEIFHSKKVFLSNMVLFLCFLSMQCRKSKYIITVFDGIRPVQPMWGGGLNPIEMKLTFYRLWEFHPKQHVGTFCPMPVPK